MVVYQDPISILRDYQYEIRQVLEEELRLIQEKRAHEAVLLKGLMQNLSLSEIIKIGRQRGRKWSFMSALADASIVIEGQGIIHLIRQIVGNNLIEQATEQAAQAISRLERRLMKYEDNPRIKAMYERSMDYVAEQPLRTTEDYWDTIRRPK